MEDNIKADLKKGEGLIHLSENSDLWGAVLSVVMDRKFP